MPSPSEPRKHHFVPQVLLRRFTDQSGMLEVYDIPYDKTYPTSTRDSGAIVDFHTLTLQDGTRDRSTVEKHLSAIEGAGGHALIEIDNLSLGATELTKESKDALAEFLALQAVRTPDKREGNRSMIDILASVQLRMSYQQGGEDGVRDRVQEILGHSPSGSELQKYIAIADGSSNESLDIGNNFLIQEMLTSVPIVKQLIESRQWRVFRHKKAWCFSSERPVILWSPRTKNSKYTGIGLATAQEIYFALDPNQMLVMTLADDWSFKLAVPTQAEMHRIRERVALRSHQRIFLRPQSNVLRNLQLSNQPPGLAVQGLRIDPRDPSWSTRRAELIDDILS